MKYIDYGFRERYIRHYGFRERVRKRDIGVRALERERNWGYGLKKERD